MSQELDDFIRQHKQDQRLYRMGGREFLGQTRVRLTPRSCPARAGW